VLAAGLRRWITLRFVVVDLFRTLLRIAILLCLAAAAVTLAAMTAEYPGSTAAGRRVLLNEVLPLVLVAWVNLYVLDRAYRLEPGARVYAAVASVVDIAMLAWTTPALSRGAAPLSVALPIIAALLFLSVLGLSAISNRRGSSHSSD
jgi:hypothetical protein